MTLTVIRYKCGHYMTEAVDREAWLAAQPDWLCVDEVTGGLVWNVQCPACRAKDKEAPTKKKYKPSGKVPEWWGEEPYSADVAWRLVVILTIILAMALALR